MGTQPKEQTRLVTACQTLLKACYEFFDAQNEELGSKAGAVKWIEFTNGEVVIFTRGEYRDRLMSVCSSDFKGETKYFSADDGSGES